MQRTHWKLAFHAKSFQSCTRPDAHVTQIIPCPELSQSQTELRLLRKVTIGEFFIASTQSGHQVIAAKQNNHLNDESILLFQFIAIKSSELFVNLSFRSLSFALPFTTNNTSPRSAPLLFKFSIESSDPVPFRKFFHVCSLIQFGPNKTGSQQKQELCCSLSQKGNLQPVVRTWEAASSITVPTGRRRRVQICVQVDLNQKQVASLHWHLVTNHCTFWDQALGLHPSLSRPTSFWMSFLTKHLGTRKDTSSFQSSRKKLRIWDWIVLHFKVRDWTRRNVHACHTNKYA